KKNHEKEDFDEKKVYASVYHPALEAGYEEEKAEWLAGEITDAVKNWIHEHHDNVHTTKEIQQKIHELLEKEDEDVAFMYEKYLEIS
ncbi:MAG: ATP cone domain-containing protein, partial [Candidatus Aenigmatarchaeota archaeon]